MLVVSLEVINHRALPTTASPVAPYKGGGGLLALGQVSASRWDAALENCDGERAEWLAVPGAWPDGLEELECPWPALCKQSEVIRR